MTNEDFRTLPIVEQVPDLSELEPMELLEIQRHMATQGIEADDNKHRQFVQEAREAKSSHEAYLHRKLAATEEAIAKLEQQKQEIIDQLNTDKETTL